MGPCRIGGCISHGTEVNHGSCCRPRIIPGHHFVVSHRRNACRPTSICDHRGNPPRNARWDSLSVGKRSPGDRKEIAIGCSERCAAVLCCRGTPPMTSGFSLDLSLLRPYLTIIPAKCSECIRSHRDASPQLSTSSLCIRPRCGAVRDPREMLAPLF